MRAPRKDVQRNRQRLVSAAREAFNEQGPGTTLEEVARRACVGPTTLYRHFPDKDDLVIAVLDELIADARDGTDSAADIPDALEAFRSVFIGSCDLSDTETETFLRLAATSPRARSHAHRLIADLVEPFTTRLRKAGGLRPEITADDIAMFIRMTVAADDHPGRAKAVQVLLDGLTRSPGARRSASTHARKARA
ncbi:TetR/AcrR family transcriptional regulator [Mycobacterium sp. 1245111.1]|uniref:TetR/AcrR family transcriptional regulator n=1 Tax=Mycobacterium sp. 1245111.1 TaxID=1834073 RepID=UPI000836120E|nr:TetR/AcrR family transcriptional regulator [Mycobacterium sp. 1245111.1]